MPIRLLAFVFTALLWAAPQAGFAKPEAVAASPRITTDLSTGWHFQFGDAPDAVTAAGFDDSAWEKVSVPHTWNRIGEYALTRGAATNNKQGVGWYRLTYAAPPSAKGRRQYLDFAAVAIIADVWVNGVHVGQHKGGYSRFRFDVTAAWKPGGTNLIVVKANNSKPAPGSSTEHVMPLAGDFFQHGGIYRGVSLIEANDVGIDLLDFGGPGVYVRTSGEKELLGNMATDGFVADIDITTNLRNLGSRKASLLLTATVNQAEIRQNQKSASQKLIVVPGKTNTVNTTIQIRDPLEWSVASRSNPVPGEELFSGPNLYSVTVEIRDGKKLIDSVSVPFGIRTAKFDPNKGFSLNGKSLKLHGVSRHQDRMGQGYALTRADHKEDMDLIAEMGANAVRMAHYQHDDAWADEADAHGMVAWAEVPFVTTPSLSGGEGSAEVFANAEQQTRELIRQNYNHPSIVMWSVGNEVDASALFGLGGGKTKPLKLLQHIAKIVREEDPSRPTVFADCCEDVSSPVAGLSAQVQGEKLAGTADLIGYNRYYGWYYPEPLKAAEQLAAQMDKFHVKHPTLPISISEYGAGGAISQHSDNVLTGYINAIGRPQPEEYESWVHEQSWPVIRDRPYIFGSYVWNMFDFASDLRNEGDAVDINTKGLVTMDRQTRKDAFYYYQAQWTDKPMIHLTGKRYVDRSYPVMDIKAYTNAVEGARLFLNGDLIQWAGCEEGICNWPRVALRPGKNGIKVVAVTNGNVETSDIATFNGPDPAKDGIHLDAGDIAGRVLNRHCERSETIQTARRGTLDCRASLAMTGGSRTRRFGSDNLVTGGTPAILNQSGFAGRSAGAKKSVTAPDPVLYDYYREGEAFSYAIPIPDGNWIVTVHTFEPREGSAALMAVAANGKPAQPAFNVAKAAGGPLKGITRTFPVTVKGGVLKLDFSATGGKAVVAAIEIAR
jgi:beta-galactosidase